MLDFEALKQLEIEQDSARQLLQRRLETIVPSAQVQLAMTEGRSNSVDLVSGVSSPGNILMPDNNFTVLAAISAGGGVQSGIENPQVKLLRGLQHRCVIPNCGLVRARLRVEVIESEVVGVAHLPAACVVHALL